MSTITYEPGANVPAIKIYPDKFSGQVVVVTGAASGIGEATATLFAQQGAHVVLLDINEANLQRVQGTLQSISNAIGGRGGQIDTQVCDVSDEASIETAISAVLAIHNKIDVLANVAGIAQFHPFLNYPTALYRRTMSVNMDGTFFMTRAVLPHMQAAGYGRIIHVSSSTFSEPEAGLSAYVASKAAIIGITRSAAVEAGPGVTVNVILPGLTATPATQGLENFNVLFEHVMRKQVVARTGHPLDQAHAICFIASPEASFFTGQIFECSGGSSFN